MCGDTTNLLLSALTFYHLAIKVSIGKDFKGKIGKNSVTV